MTYLKISNELLNGSFWDSLSFDEQGILINLMKMAAYKPFVYKIHQCEIHLNKFEACVSVNALADRFSMGRKKLANLLGKLAEHRILRISTIDVCRKGNDLGNDKGNDKNGFSRNRKFTLLSFYGWVFAASDTDRSEDSSESNKEMIGETINATHKIDIKTDKEEEVLINARGENFQNYENGTILFAEKPELQQVIPEKSVTYFREYYECRTEDLENMFRNFIRQQEASGMYFLRHKELQRRFAYFLEKSYQTKFTHAKKSNFNGNIKQQQPEKQREKSDYEKRREAEDAAIIATMPRYGGSSERLHAIRKRERRYGTKKVE